MSKRIFFRDEDQARYDDLLTRMTPQRTDLARALFATERTGRHDGFDADRPIAPIYTQLASCLAECRESRRTIISMLEALDG